MLLNKKIWSILTVFLLITLHLKLFAVGNFGVSPVLLLIPIWLYSSFFISYSTNTKFEIALIFSLIIMPFIPMHIENYSEFLNSYLQYLIGYFFVVKAYQKNSRLSAVAVDDALIFFQMLLCIFVGLQYISSVLMSVPVLYNVFGDYQMYYQLPLFIESPRMKGFYLEPSYLGFVVVNVFWCRVMLNEGSVKLWNIVLTFSTLVLAKSAFAYFAIFLLLLFHYWTMLSNNRSAIRKYLVLIVAAIVMYGTYDFLLSIFRFAEVANTDRATSGNMRVLLPLLVVKKMLIEDGYIFGLPFGQLDSYLQSVKFVDYYESGMNNSFFAIVGNWGVLALLLYVVVAHKFFWSKNYQIRSYILLILINLNSSGAYLTMQFVFVAVLLPMLVMTISSNIMNKVCCKEKVK